MIIGIPLVLMSTGYALYSQRLNVEGSVTKPAYSMGQKMLFTYTSVVTQSGSKWNYTINGTMRNNGTTSTESWSLKYDLPAGTSTPACTSVTCTMSGVTVTVASQVANNAIAPGGTAAFTMTFSLTTPTYQLANIVTAAVLPVQYAAYTGLTATMTRTSTPAKVGGKWTSDYSFTVKNTTAQPLVWKISATPWVSASNTVVATGTSTTMNYSSLASELQITSKSALPVMTGTLTFTMRLTGPNNTWALTAVPIVGAP